MAGGGACDERRCSVPVRDRGGGVCMATRLRGLSRRKADSNDPVLRHHSTLSLGQLERAAGRWRMERTVKSRWALGYQPWSNLDAVVRGVVWARSRQLCLIQPRRRGYRPWAELLTGRAPVTRRSSGRLLSRLRKPPVWRRFATGSPLRFPSFRATMLRARSLRTHAGPPRSRH